jgi:hypothetical protein
MCNSCVQNTPKLTCSNARNFKNLPEVITGRIRPKRERKGKRLGREERKGMGEGNGIEGKG